MKKSKLLKKLEEKEIAISRLSEGAKIHISDVYKIIGKKRTAYIPEQARIAQFLHTKKVELFKTNGQLL